MNAEHCITKIRILLAQRRIDADTLNHVDAIIATWLDSCDDSTVPSTDCPLWRFYSPLLKPNFRESIAVQVELSQDEIDEILG